MGDTTYSNPILFRGHRNSNRTGQYYVDLALQNDPNRTEPTETPKVLIDRHIEYQTEDFAYSNRHSTVAPIDIDDDFRFIFD